MAITRCILAIETSCDETAISVVETVGSGKNRFLRVLANEVASQVKLHAAFGGVVPNLARREHEKNLVPILLAALKKAGLLEKVSRIRYPISSKGKSDSVLNTKYLIVNTLLNREPELLEHVKEHIAKIKPPKIDAIAVTYGPGLAPALWVGVNFARALAELWNVPLIPVNHLEGHMFTNFLGEEISENSKSQFPISKQVKNPNKISAKRYALNVVRYPVLCLIVSGGHTELVLMASMGTYKILGETRDDAAGEAFDKVAKMLGMGYPGGPAISALAEAKFSISPDFVSGKAGETKSRILDFLTTQERRKNRDNFQFPIKLPRPMIASADYSFSFSGLKTAVLYFLQDHPEFLKSREGRAAIAREFQSAVVDVLVSKTIRAAKEYQAQTVMIGGGVAANTHLRKRLTAALEKELPGTSYFLPPITLTGDNALMIALAAILAGKKRPRTALEARPNLRLDEQ